MPASTLHTEQDQDTPAARPRRISAHVWALVGYFLLALAATYPTITHFSTQVVGDLLADRNQNLWNLWWAREALSTLTNPFHTGVLYYPYGADLYYHTLALPLGLIGLIPQALFGLPAAYNTVLLAAFTLSGYGAFRLGLLFTGNPLASFLGGFVFAFTPYTLDALKGQIEVLSVQWMPLYAEAWIRSRMRNVPDDRRPMALAALADRRPVLSLRRKGPVGAGATEGIGAARAKEQRRSLFYAALAGLFLALAALSSLYYAVYLVIFTAVHIAYTGLGHRRSGRRRGEGTEPTLAAEEPTPVDTHHASRITHHLSPARTYSPATGHWSPVITAAVALVLTFPLLAGLVASHGNPRLEVRADPAHRLSHSADLLSFLAMPHDHPLFGQGVDQPGVQESPLHDYLSLGYAALLLAVIGGVTAWRRSHTPFWVLLGVVALVLSMGPELQVGRNLTGIPLPFKLVEDLPGADAIAKPERFVVLARLCMGVLAAWGAVWVLSGARSRDPVAGGQRSPVHRPSSIVHRRSSFFLTLLALLLLELPLHPRYVEPLAIPEGYDQLARERGRGALMELPFATQQSATLGERMLYQTVHGRPIMGGYLARNYLSPITDECSPFWSFISARELPVKAEDIATPRLASRPLDVLNFYEIGYVALYSRYSGPQSEPLDPAERAAFMDILSRVSHAPPLRHDDYLALYKVDEATQPDPSPAFHVGNGWYKAEMAAGAPFRWLDGQSGTLCVFAPRPLRAALAMEGTAYAREQEVEVWVAGRRAYSGRLPSGGRFAPVRTEPLEWPAGVTEVRVRAEGPGTTPRSLDPNVQDDRVLGVGFRAVHLERMP